MPEDNLFTRRGRREENKHRDGGAGDGIRGDTHQNKVEHLNFAGRAGKLVHEQRGENAGDERACRHRPGAKNPCTKDDGKGRADAGTTGDTDDGRLRKRIGEHRLHECATQSECRTDE